MPGTGRKQQATIWYCWNAEFNGGRVFALWNGNKLNAHFVASGL